MRRFFFLVFILLMLAAFGRDMWLGPGQGQPVSFRSTADYWVAMDKGSLIGLNAMIEKNISPMLWDILVLPLLSMPAFLLAGLLAFFLFLIRKRQPRQRKGMMFPKRRR